MKTIKWDGEPISKPGMYSGLDIDIYHAAKICDSPSISSSGLRQIFSESPAHFFADWRGNEDRAETAEKRHFILGRAAHHLLLGQAHYSTLFVTEPGEYEDPKTGEVKPWNNNADECKRWRRQHKDMTVVKPKEAEQIIGMAKELARHPLIQHGAMNGLVERSLFWKDPVTGIWLKSRPDSIPTHSGDFVDYKSTTSTRWDDLVRSIYDFGYYQQGALVRTAAREVLGIDKQFTFTLIFQEKKPPHCARVVTLKDHMLDLGDKANRVALDTFASCLKSNNWPGPGGYNSDAEWIEMSDRASELVKTQIELQGGRL